MKEIFEQYGSVIIAAVAISALVAIIVMLLVLLISWAVTELISNVVIDLLMFLSLLILHGRFPAHWIYHIFTYFDNSRSAYAILQASTFFSFVQLSRSRFQKESESDASSVPISQLGMGKLHGCIWMSFMFY